MRRLLSPLVSVVVSFAMLPHLSRAEVIISEIMYNPQGTDLDTSVTPNISREWAEIYNTGNSAVDIGGWQFGDAADSQWASAFPAGTVIQAHQALVVTGDAASFDTEWGTGINRIQVSSFPLLANTPSTNVERPTIRNASLQVIDAVQYNENFNALVDPWPKINGDDGHSIFVVPQGLTSALNDHGAYWKPSMWDVYGAKFRTADGENHGSPGFVATVPQAPFAPSPDAAWSIAIMPDTQNYVKWAEYQPILVKMTQWIRDHRDDYKIKLVMQEGDIVNNNNTNNPSSGDQTSSQQWPAAQAGMFALNGYLPYIMAAGNHDFGFTNADNRDTKINDYFKPSDNPLVDPAQGGILKGEMVNGEIQNSYYAFTAPDGRKILVLDLEWEPRAATVTWANSIAALPQYADYTAMLLTHNYLQADNTRSTTTNEPGDASGETLWQNLVKTHSNFEMVFNGHFGGDGVGFLDSTDNAGKTVHQMFLNSQFETLGGDGWIRILEFLQDGTTVRVRTYSPFQDLYRTGPDYNFEFQLSPLPPEPGDYNGNHIVDAADYVLYRKDYGLRTGSTADANHDGIVDEFDYQIWRQRFGNPFPASGSLTTAIPEPSAGALLLVLSVCGLFSSRCPRRIPIAA